MNDDIKLQKMTITAFEDIKFKKECGRTVVQINPDTFTRTLNVTWNAEQARKSKNGTGRFSSFSAEKYSFMLCFDGTGVVDDSRKSVKARVDEFLSATYKTRSTSEEGAPVYFKLNWCGEEFRCVTDSIIVKYTLFDISGSPLRATLTCSFSSVEEPKEENEKPEKVEIPAVKNECPRPTKEEACRMCSGGFMASMLKIMESRSKGSLIPERD